MTPYDKHRWFDLLAAARGALWGISLVVLSAKGGSAVAQQSATPPPAVSVPPLPRVAPLPPEDAVRSFRVRDGFAMQLIAAEPLVASPVALEYDEDGRAFVAEMRDYPYTDKASDQPFVERTKDAPLGRVRLLEDTDGDGVFDKSTVFAADLSWPTGLACWDGGLYVVATPDLWYLKDTDGDGRADLRRPVFTGFRKFNVQAVINNLKWGLDGFLYGAGSSNGGSIRAAAVDGAAPVVMRTADFRFRPGVEQFELLSGGARFGNTFNDQGDRFICNIRNPIQHVVLPRHYLARNPLLAVRSALHDVAEAGDAVPVFRRSPPEPWRVANARRLAHDATLASPRSEMVAAGYLTSASGLTLYRGSAFPGEYYGSAFLGEVAGNLIHHQTLTRDGVTFSARRSLPREEFVTSTDNWFRPVNFANAPDGTLHVVDMYRETIEHPWSIPDDIKSRLDLESGRERGRIYRLAPVGFRPAPAPKLSTATTAELVDQLAQPDVWRRETARRLLRQRSDAAAVPLLRELLHGSFEPARLHALYQLSAQDSLLESDLLALLDDPSADVAAHAILLCESRLAGQPRLLARLPQLAGDQRPRVQFQLAFTLGTMVHNGAGHARPEVVAALARLGESNDEWVRAAVLSSSAEVLAELFDSLTRRDQAAQADAVVAMARSLAAMIGSRARPAELTAVFSAVDAWQAQHAADGSPRFLVEVTLGLGEGLKRAKRTLPGVLADSPARGAAALRKGLEDAVEAVVLSSGRESDSGPTPETLALLEYVEPVRGRELLTNLLQPQSAPAAQSAAVRILAGHAAPDLPPVLLRAYRQLSPPARAEAIEALLARPAWHEPLLDAVVAGTIRAAEIPHARRNTLLRSSNAAVQTRAVALFQTALAARRQVLDRYRDALTTLTPDAARGEAVFRRECQTCHRVRELGTEIGPNLATIHNRAAEEVLLHVLDPNREVAPNFVANAIALDDGRVLSGLIVAETPASITLATATGARETLLRSSIEQITSAGQSLMPEGLEDRITPQEMSDLIAWLLGQDQAPPAIDHDAQR